MTAEVHPQGAATATAPEPLRRLRIYDSVRTAHLERFRTMEPATVLHRARRYDFDASLADDLPEVRQLDRAATIVHLLRRRYDAVEVNEPLMMGRWADLATQLAAVRLRSAASGRRTTVGAYCISLTDPVERLVQRRRVPRPLARWWSHLVLRRLVRSMDRLAFGTQASRDLLARYVGEDLLAPRERLFPALSAPCDCSPQARDEAGVVFLGSFSDRKGIRQLMVAWDVLGADHRLSLRLIGKGDLLPEVEAWVAGRSDVELVVDPPRAEIHEALHGAHVLVLLSQRVGAWREQVGLPIVEGLAHGCEIVTTAETGLAGWLREHGHAVLPLDAGAAEVATAIRTAAAATRAAGSILADLPGTDPRWEADRWLLAAPGNQDPEMPARAEPAGSGSPSSVARLYVASARRSIRKYGVSPRGLVARFDDRPVFVVGSPRSGTSFTAETIGIVPGFADLGELRPLKRAIPELVVLPAEEAAARIRTTLRRAQRLGLVSGRRGVEQTPESTFLIEAIARAFPQARFLHLVRDGRDVAASLIGLGWLREMPEDEADEVGAAFGAHSRFWVEPERRDEFAKASEASRAAWVWRRYESTARRLLEPLAGRTLEIRYETLVSEPAAVAHRLAEFLDSSSRAAEFTAAFGATRGSASGRWRRDLDPVQLRDVEQEAGDLLARLGYSG